MGVGIQVIHAARRDISCGKASRKHMNIQGIRPERTLGQKVPGHAEYRTVQKHGSQKQLQISPPHRLLFQEQPPGKAQDQYPGRRKGQDQRNRIGCLNWDLEIIALINGREHQAVEKQEGRRHACPYQDQLRRQRLQPFCQEAPWLLSSSQKPLPSSLLESGKPLQQHIPAHSRHRNHHHKIREHIS